MGVLQGVSNAKFLPLTTADENRIIWLRLAEARSANKKTIPILARFNSTFSHFEQLTLPRCEAGSTYQKQFK